MFTAHGGYDEGIGSVHLPFVTSTMSYTRKIAHNSIIQMAGKAVSTIIGVVVIGMLTRYLGEEGFGHYTTIMAFLQFFGVLVDMGLYIVLVKKIAQPDVDQDSIVSNIFTLRLISAVVFLGIAPLVVLLFPYDPIVKVGVAVTAVSFLAVTLNQALTGVFQKELRMDRVVIAEVVGRIILIGMTFVAIQMGLGLLWVMGAVVAGSVTNVLITFAFSRRFVRIRLRFDMTVWKRVITESWPIALSVAFNLVYFKADTIILSLFHDAGTVGIYGASYKVLEVLTTFPAMFAGLVLPLLAGAWAVADRERFQRVLRKAFDAMAMIALPLIVGTYFMAEPVMHLIAPEFTDSPAVLRILIIATATIFIGNLFGNTVVAINKQRTMMWLYLLVAIVSLGGYLVFVPEHSYFGAAWMTVVSELLVTLSALVIVGRTTRAWPSLQVLLRAVVASGIMGVMLYLLQDLNVLVLIVLAAIVYLGALFTVGGIRKDMIIEIMKLRT